jgi:DNA polymerase III sliding clamp (beta) subunit (PCNA family)
MKGVCVRTFNGNVSIIGTDGRRFHYLIGPEAFEPVLLALDESGAETGFDKGILIGREMLAVIQRMLSDDEGKCKLRVSRQCAEVESFGRSVKFAISNDGPPDISKLVEGATYSIECVVDRLRMLKIVMTAAPLGAGESLAITIHYVKGAVRVEADDSRGNTFVDEFPANPSRVNVAFRVSANYMIDFLKASNLEEIAIGYQKDFHMLMFREDDRFITVALMRDNTIPKELNPY